jgi:hypothetical protein
MAYAIPTSRLKPTDDSMLIMDDGLFMFDSRWREVYRKIRPIGQKQPTSAKAPKFLLSERKFHLPGGIYNLVVEVGDRVSGSVGTFRTERQLAIVGSGLAMSDLLLAQRIDMGSDFPEKRSDLKIVPNPLRTFAAGQPASVYLEVYNLNPNEFGQTQYEIAYQVGVPDKEEVDPALFGAVALRKSGGLLVVPTPEELVEMEGQRSSAEVLAEAEGEEGEVDVEQAQEEISAEAANLEVQYVLAERNQLADSLERLRKSGQQGETEIRSQYTGNQRNDFTFLEIDLSKMPGGIYKLNVTVTDLLAKQQVNRNVLFRVQLD